MDKSELMQLILNADSTNIGGNIFFSTEHAVDLPFLDTKKLRVEYYQGEIDAELLADGIWNLTRLEPTMKQEIFGEVLQWYRSNIEALGYDTPAEAIEDEELNEHVPPKDEKDLSGLITFFSITGRIRQSDDCAILSIRGDTAWDCEHGIALFFENGERLVKVGDLNDGFE